MSKTAMIRARVSPELKADAEGILEKLGLSATDAITLFYQQIKLNRGLPFAVRLPNRTTRKTFDDTDAGRGVTRVKDQQELFERLEL